MLSLEPVDNIGAEASAAAGNEDVLLLRKAPLPSEKCAFLMRDLFLKMAMTMRRSRPLQRRASPRLRYPTRISPLMLMVRDKFFILYYKMSTAIKK